MLINKKQIKEFCKDRDLQVSDEYLNRLNYLVLKLIIRSIKNLPTKYMRLTDVELTNVMKGD